MRTLAVLLAIFALVLPCQADQRITEAPATQRSQQLARIYISPGRVALVPGKQLRFKAFGIDEKDGETPLPAAVKWSCDPRAGTIDSSGLFTAATNTGVFEMAVRASSGKFKTAVTVETLAASPQDGYVLERTIGGVVPGVLNGAEGIAVDAKGFIYVADKHNNCIQKFDAEGASLGIWGRDLANDVLSVAWPQSLAFDNRGSLYLSASGQVYRFDQSGRLTYNLDISFPNAASSLAVDKRGFLYMTVEQRQCVEKHNSSGKLVAKFGLGDGKFIRPNGVAVDSKGCIYVTDDGAHRLLKLNSSGKYITQWSGLELFAMPCGIVIDPSDNLYVVDSGYHYSRVQVFDAGGKFVRSIGSFGRAWGELNCPRGLALDGSGNLLVADTDNNRIVRFDKGGKAIGQFGGSGLTNGYMRMPFNMSAVDSQGNIYVEDIGTDQRINKFDASGAFLMRLEASRAWDLAIDCDDNLYMATGKSIKKIDPSGKLISQFAINESDVGSSMYNHLAVDRSGNCYLAGQDHIYKFDSAGNRVSVLGPWGKEGDKPAGQLSLATDSAGDLFVSDCDNRRLVKFDNSGKLVAMYPTGQGALKSIHDIYAIADDRRGGIWVQGGDGVFPVNGIRFAIRLDSACNFLGQVNLPHGDAARIGHNGNVYIMSQEHSCFSIYAPVVAK